MNCSIENERDRLRLRCDEQGKSIVRYQQRIKELAVENKLLKQELLPKEGERTREELEARVRKLEETSCECSRRRISSNERQELLDLLEARRRGPGAEEWRDRYCKAQGELNELKVALTKLLEFKK